MDRQQVELTSADVEAITHLRQAIHAGKHWYIALLETIRLWQTFEEKMGGKNHGMLNSLVLGMKAGVVEAI